jgi:hypothetical protein
MRARMHRVALFAVLLVSFAMFRAPQSAYACSCASFDPESRFSSADAVFRGRVVYADYAPASPGRWAGAPSSVQTGFLVEVKDIHKGQVPSRVYFAYYYNWMCSGPPPFSVGSEYLFYSHQTPQGFAPIGGCARVVPMANAGGDYAHILGLHTAHWPVPLRAVANALIAVGVYMPWLLPVFALLGLVAVYYHVRGRRLIMGAGR